MENQVLFSSIRSSRTLDGGAVLATRLVKRPELLGDSAGLEGGVALIGNRAFHRATGHHHFTDVDPLFAEAYAEKARQLVLRRLADRQAESAVFDGHGVHLGVVKAEGRRP